MRSSTIRTMGVMVLVALSAGLMGCPPEGEGLPPELEGNFELEVYDLLDYWPMAEGNTWEYVNIVDGIASMEIRVTDEFMVGPHTVWEVILVSTSVPNPVENTIYFIEHPDFLLQTFYKSDLEYLPDDPSDLAAMIGVGYNDSQFDVTFPRRIIEGARVADYSGYRTFTGTIENLTPFSMCLGDAWEASDFPIFSNTHTIVADTHLKVCDDGQVYVEVSSWYALKIGPLVYGGSFALTRAVVDGEEYTF